MRKLFAMVVIAVIAGFSAGSVDANCGPAHPCQGAYCN